MLWWSLLFSCGPQLDDDGDRTVLWSGALAPLVETHPPIRGRAQARAIVHLHSPWSHDACDGKPLLDGEPREDCLADLRHALCETAIDVAFLTDHPAHAADQPYESLLLLREGDVPVYEDGQRVGSRIPCANGHEVLWLPGIEGRIMPAGLLRHAGEAPADRHAVYQSATPEAMVAVREAGAVALIPHTESKDPELLRALQDGGMQGVELFNLHAMFAPDIRKDHLGLEAWAWMSAIAPFTSPDGTAEPDLLFLGVLEEQVPSVQRWDDLLTRGPMTGVAGSDAHQNVLPLDLRDGERGDSYRRMLRWFSNILLVDGSSPEHQREALAAGRVYVAFEVLGTPAGFDFHLVDSAGALHEMGATAGGGTLQVGCPRLGPGSPRGEDDPEVTVTVLRDGQPWRTGCGAFDTDGPGAYRVRVDLVPHHLRPFLGDDPEPWLRSYPWIYGNAIRVQ